MLKWKSQTTVHYAKSSYQFVVVDSLQMVVKDIGQGWTAFHLAMHSAI